MEVRRRRTPGHQAGPAGGELTSTGGTTDAPRPRRKVPALRLALYALLLAAGLPAALWSGRPNDPTVDIAALVEATRTPGPSSYRSEGASLFLAGEHGWTLCVYTGSAPRYRADFLVVRRQEGVLSVELITDPRAAGHVATAPQTAMTEVHLAGQAAVEYLARVELSVAPFDALVGRAAVARADVAAPASR